jgi:hypothetical protein
MADDDVEIERLAFGLVILCVKYQRLSRVNSCDLRVAGHVSGRTNTIGEAEGNVTAVLPCCTGSCLALFAT